MTKRRKVGVICVGVVLASLLIGAKSCGREQALELAFQLEVQALQMGWPYLDAAAQKQCSLGRWTAAQCAVYENNKECVKTALLEALPVLTEAWIDSIQKGELQSPKVTTDEAVQAFLDFYASLPKEQQVAIREALSGSSL